MGRSPGLRPRFWIRTAGFPLAWIDGLRAPSSAALADEVAAIDEVISVLATEIESAIDAELPRGTAKMRRAIERREPIASFEGFAAAETWNARLAERRTVWERFERALESEMLESRHNLRRLFGNPELRSAVFSTSRSALEMLDRMRADPLEKRDSKSRYREIEAALFLQRMCAKNETVAFFGPLGWGEIDRDRQENVYREGRPAIARRRVAFEYWAAQAIAETVSADPEIADDLPLRLHPACRVDGGVLHYPIGKHRAIDARTVNLIAAADGRSTRALLEGGAYQKSDLDPLLRARVIERGLFLPTMTDRPEDRLAEAVARLAPSSARDRWQGEIAELFALRDAYASLSEAEIEARREILGKLDARFFALTERAALRGEGEMYVGRSLVYEDCFLQTTLVLSDRAARRIESALHPVMKICRWVVREVAARVLERYLAVFDSLGGSEVDLLAFSQAARPVDDDAEAIAASVRARLNEAWSKAQLPAEGAEISATHDTFERVIASLPSSPERAILGEDIHSPDLFLSARGSNALVEGDFRVVLGEIHKMVYYEAHPVGWPFCPGRSEVEARLRAILPDLLPRVMDAPQHHHSRGFHFPAGTVLDVVVPGTSPRPGARSAPISELRVRRSKDGLEVHHPPSGAHAPLLSVLQNLLYRVSDAVPPIPSDPRPHLPRLIFEDTVLRRRLWRIEAETTEALRASSTTAAALVEAARLRKRLDLPERIFVKSPEEPKPVLIDLFSPLSVELLVKLARKAPYLRCSEMLPGLEGCWLEVQGASRTSELRFTYLLEEPA